MCVINTETVCGVGGCVCVCMSKSMCVFHPGQTLRSRRSVSADSSTNTGVGFQTERRHTQAAPEGREGSPQTDAR